MPPKLERLPPPAYAGRYFALSERKTTGAYDDQQPRAKRRKVMDGNQNYMERPLMSFPATSMAAFTFGCIHRHYDVDGSIPSRALTEAGDSPRSDPIASMGMLRRVPAEVRDEIFRYLLLWSHDIRVLRVWSLVYPRTRPRLSLSLLRTCEVFRRQGIRILYGENRFEYLIRDPAETDDAAMSYSMAHVFENCNLHIDRYGHLIRHIRIIVEANRMSPRHIECFVRSVAKFGPNNSLLVPANLRSVTIEVPAVTQRDLDGYFAYGGITIGDDDDGDATRNPRDVPIRRFFNDRAVDALEKLNTQFIRILAADRRGRSFEYVIDMRYHVGDRRRKRRSSRLIGMSRSAKTNKDDDVAGDVVMRHTREKLTRAAILHLRNLPFALELLALYPRRAVYMWRLWDFAAPAAKPVNDDETVSLPDDFRETSDPASQATRRGHLTERLLERDASEDEEDVSMKGNDAAGVAVPSARSLLTAKPRSSSDFVQILERVQKEAKQLRVGAAPELTVAPIATTSLPRPPKASHNSNNNSLPPAPVAPKPSSKPTPAKLPTDRIAGPTTTTTKPENTPSSTPLARPSTPATADANPAPNPNPNPIGSAEQETHLARIQARTARAEPAVAESRALRAKQAKKVALQKAKEAVSRTQSQSEEEKDAAMRAMREAEAAYQHASLECERARNYTESVARRRREEEEEEGKRRRGRGRGVRTLPLRRKACVAQTQTQEGAQEEAMQPAPREGNDNDNTRPRELKQQQQQQEETTKPEQSQIQRLEAEEPSR